MELDQFYIYIYKLKKNSMVCELVIYIYIYIYIQCSEWAKGDWADNPNRNVCISFIMFQSVKT
jgi:hypothetical protein